MAFKAFDNAKKKLTGRSSSDYAQSDAPGDERAKAGAHARDGRASAHGGRPASASADARFRHEAGARTRGDSGMRTRSLAGTRASHGGSRAHEGASFSSQPTQQMAPGHPGRPSSFRGLPPAGRGRRRKPNWITRQVNGWTNRLVGAVAEGTLFEQEEQYASHRTSRDYIWNSIGLGTWGVVFPILSIVVTQLVGVDQAGKFAMAFTTALLLMFVANYGVRTYQVSDLDEEHTFADYQINRILTCVVMLIVGLAYCWLRGYDDQMFTICLGVYLYKMADGWADVYEGRLQQVDKLYLAGISQTFRSVAVLLVFSLALLITRNLAVSCIVMAVVALASLVVLTIPLALFETPKSRRFSLRSIAALFKQCFPLFVALFMYNLIENMPKFMMEGSLSYDNQLYYNAMWFPANALVIIVQLIYKPLLVRMAAIWADMKLRKRFDILVVAMVLLVVLITAGVGAVMWAVGAPVLGFLYGVDFEQFRGLIVIMVVAGGVSAAIDFLYQAITVLRRQGSVTKLYLMTFGFSLFIPLLLISFTGLPGAVLSYLIIMSILLVLLVWEYLRIRIALANEPVAQAGAPRGGHARAHASDSASRRSVREGDAFAAARDDAGDYDDYAGVPIERMSSRERARAAHADKVRREQAAAKRAERAARRASAEGRGISRDDERGGRA